MGPHSLSRSILSLLPLPFREFELGRDILVVRHFDVDLFTGILSFLDFRFELFEIRNE